VLLLAANGSTNEQIADVLAISRMTVQRHLQNIRAALGARDRTHAVALAIRQGSVRVDDIEALGEAA
jgi:two-component system NarL family response regulator